MPTAAPATTRCSQRRSAGRGPRGQEARLLIDVGHGGGSFDYTVCEAALQQGFAPDIISSDVHSFSVNSPGKPFLPWVMSKFLNLGCRSSRW